MRYQFRTLKQALRLAAIRVIQVVMGRLAKSLGQIFPGALAGVSLSGGGIPEESARAPLSSPSPPMAECSAEKLPGQIRAGEDWDRGELPSEPRQQP